MSEYESTTKLAVDNPESAQDDMSAPVQNLAGGERMLQGLDGLY